MDVDYYTPPPNINPNYYRWGRNAATFGKGIFDSWNSRRKKSSFASKANLKRVQRIAVAARKADGRKIQMTGVPNLNFGKKRRRFTTATSYGKFGKGKVNKLKGRKAKIANCIEYRVERGGAVTSPQCVYIGASCTPVTQMLNCLGGAIVKELFRQCGKRFDQWSDFPLTFGVKYRLRFNYYASPTTATLTTVTVNTYDLDADTYQVIAEELGGSLATTFGGSATKLYMNEVYIETLHTTLSTVITGIVYAHQFKFTFESKVSLNLQNQTVSSDSDDKITDVTNNPLHGKMYFTNSNGFVARTRSTLATSGSLVSDAVTGVIASNNEELGTDIYKKPPHAHHFLGVKSYKNVVLMPGQMSEKVIQSSFTMNLKTMLLKLHTNLVDNNTLTFMGKSILFALEKKLDVRGETAGISVGWENNSSFGGHYVYRPKILTQPILEVQ